ncbi:MAG: sensor histidine kinase [Actinomycetota bacterium]|nr:sensor histidine kinase [Actinomycetota bacterium]
MFSNKLDESPQNRWVWAFTEAPKDSRRPAVFVLLFWTCWVATLSSHAFGLLDEDPAFGLVPVVVALVVQAALWTLLPWSPGAAPRRMLWAPAFLAGTFVVGYVTELNLSITFFALVVANGVFLFGLRRGGAYAAAALPVLFLNDLLVDGMATAMATAAIAVPFALFMIGISAAIVEATGRREQAQVLLGELEATNADLVAQATRIRELSVSEERARMAREIHDSVGHHLTVINLQLQNARRFREREPDGAWEEVEGARQLALAALSEVRRAVRALKPLDVEGATGAHALAALARNFDGTGIDVSFETRGEERELPEEAELVLYRAMQEGLTNAARHARARRVRAKLTFSHDAVRLAVADDGRGPGGATTGGFGLGALRGRVEALGGTAAWGGRLEGGFALEVELPVGPGRAVDP